MLELMDVVYLVKDTKENEELRYSLRSVEKNFPYRKVVFVGGVPDGILPDCWISVKQNGDTKWDNTHRMIQAACLCKNVSDDFVLFNDDFFVMKNVEALHYFYKGTLLERANELEKAFPNSPSYRHRLMRAERMLHGKGYSTFNYELHTPIVINKKKMLEIYKMFPFGSAVRSLYANVFCGQGLQCDDVKIYDMHTVPTGEETFLSTMDKTFKNGAVGDYIRRKFLDKSSFELG